MIEDNSETEPPLIPRVSCTEMSEEEEIMSENSSGSSDTTLNLPNVDGADSETSSEDESCVSLVKKKHLKSINHKSSNISQSSLEESYLDRTKKASISLLGDSVTVFEMSHRGLPNNDETTKVNKGTLNNSMDADYTDALYTMGFFSPHSRMSFEFPRADTPVKIAQITIQPLAKDIAAFEETYGLKLKISATSTSPSQDPRSESRRKRKYLCSASNPVTQLILGSESDKKTLEKPPFILQCDEDVEMNTECPSDFKNSQREVHNVNESTHAKEDDMETSNFSPEEPYNFNGKKSISTFIILIDSMRSR